MLATHLSRQGTPWYICLVRQTSGASEISDGEVALKKYILSEIITCHYHFISYQLLFIYFFPHYFLLLLSYLYDYQKCVILDRKEFIKIDNF